MSLLLLNVTLRGVTNKHCLLSLFSLKLVFFCFAVAIFDIAHDVKAIHGHC